MTFLGGEMVQKWSGEVSRDRVQQRKFNGGGGIRTRKPLRAPVFKTGALAVLPPLRDWDSKKRKECSVIRKFAVIVILEIVRRLLKKF